MFGYVTIRKDDLKIKDYDKYHAYYCGVCQDLKESYGFKGQATLTYDMTFLAILLTSLYEDKTVREEHYCIAHPGRKHVCLRNEFTRYAADMNILLTYYNLLDDWEDEKKHAAYVGAKALRGSFLKVAEKYPRQTRAVKEYLKKIHICEAEKSRDLDQAAGYTGEVLAKLYQFRDDIWKEDLGRLGFFIGKFIYLMDAYEDVEKDKKSGNYNPLVFLQETDGFEEAVERILLMMTAEASRAFEKLPILENVDILRNILYAGIWTKYEMLKRKRESEDVEKKH